LLLHELEWIGVVVMPAAWLLFTFEYTSREAFVTRRNVGVLSVLPVVTLALALTMDSHGLIYVDRTVEVYGEISLITADYGPWFWVFTAYTYALLGTGTLLILQLVASAGTMYRGQAGALLVTVVAPWLGNVAYIGGVVPEFDPTPFMFLVSGVAGIGALTQFDLLDSAPVSSRIAHQSVIESMDDGVVVTDATDAIVEINPRATDILDRTRETAIQTAAGDLVPGYETLKDTDDPEACETFQVEGDDGMHYYEASLTGVRGDRESGSIVVIHEVTDRRNRVQQLDVLNRVLRHNLRNEMNVVYGYADRLDDDDAVNRIKERAMTMVDLGNKAREIDRILNDDEGDPEPVSFDEIATIEIERARETYPDVGIERSLPDSESTVPKTLGPVLRNLIENAAEHNTSEKPRITVDAHVEGDNVVVTVTDNGPGIPDQERAVLQSGEETPLQHSSGLGLWLVNWGVETMGGAVSIEEAGEEGTEVRIEVPATVSQAVVAHD
jgi:signal transduction histidine kinase